MEYLRDPGSIVRDPGSIVRDPGSIVLCDFGTQAP